MATTLRTRATSRLLLHTVDRINSSELIAAATTQTISLQTLPAGAVLESVWTEVVVPFADAGSISATTIEVGSASDPDSLAGAVDLFGTTAGDRSEIKGVWEAGSGLAVKAKFTATGANFGDGATSDLDAGIVDVHMTYRILAG
jgi:hypothetical protein